MEPLRKTFVSPKFSRDRVEILSSCCGKMLKKQYGVSPERVLTFLKKSGAFFSCDRCILNVPCVVTQEFNDGVILKFYR